ncbi:hypothetical protein JW711_00015 [Candidatus Woesearchaeota archaeon]|nr:hypothetical protein [Candidatus Woesearchaeota archaeon]
MGLFDIFKKKRIEEIHFSDIDNWLQRELESKSLDKKVLSAKEEISRLLDSCEKSIETLEEANLMNDKIPLKEKQIMEGHRKSYTQKVRRFINAIEVPEDHSQIGHYTARFSESLNELSEETRKNFQVLQHFFSQEVSRIVKDIKGIDESLSSLQSDIEKEGLDLIREAKLGLKNYRENLERKDRLENDLEGQKKNLSSLKRRREKLRENIAELHKSEEYGAFEQFLEKKKSIEDEMREIEQDLTAMFAEISRPLKKYTHNTEHEPIVEKYLSDPVGALHEDEELIIHKIVEKMKLDLHMLELKEKQLESTKDKIENLTLAFLKEKRDLLRNLKENNKDLASKINRSVVALTLSENESWLKSLEAKIIECERHLEETVNEFEQISPNYLKQKVKEKIRQIRKDIHIHDD